MLSPVPYFPVTGFLRKYRHRSAIPRRDRLGSLEVEYPRFLSVPMVFKPLDGVFLFLRLWWACRKIRKTFDFDVIDAHLAYPEGFACAWLARWAKKPLVVTLRGHDINDLPKYPVRFRQVKYALSKARRVIAVAGALRRAAIEHGCDGDKIETVGNGVRADQFYPESQVDARRALGLPFDRKMILSVGHLVERKGHHLLVEVLAKLHERGHRDAYLVIVGGPGDEGNFGAVVRETIERTGMAAHVHLAGAQPNDRLRDWYNAADVFALASAKEGWANVLMEAMACGKPPVATRVWGTPEVITDESLGILVERTIDDISRGIEEALERTWDHAAISGHARARTWDAVAETVVSNFERAIGPECAIRVDQG